MGALKFLLPCIVGQPLQPIQPRCNLSLDLQRVHVSVFVYFVHLFFEWILHFKFFISGARAYDHLITFHNNPFQVLMILSSYMDVKKKKTDML